MDMDYLQVTIDKFVFRVAPGCRYSDADLWAKRVENRVRVGLTDYLQQKSGDVAFVDLKEVGTVLIANDELAAVETIKVDLVIPAPLAGKIVTVNDQLSAHPELVNSDPYGAGWLVEIEPKDIADYDALLDAETYLPQMKARAELEREK
jgi:glycine cleavage system H protein